MESKFTVIINSSDFTAHARCLAAKKVHFLLDYILFNMTTITTRVTVINYQVIKTIVVGINGYASVTPIFVSLKSFHIDIVVLLGFVSVGGWDINCYPHLSSVGRVLQVPDDMAASDTVKALNNRGRVYVKLAMLVLAEDDASEVRYFLQPPGIPARCHDCCFVFVSTGFTAVWCCCWAYSWLLVCRDIAHPCRLLGRADEHDVIYDIPLLRGVC